MMRSDPKFHSKLTSQKLEKNPQNGKAMVFEVPSWLSGVCCC